MTVRVIVDENAGPGSKLWEAFCRLSILGGESECLLLKDAHPGIPDVEILDKLLGPDTVLVTADRVLHRQAIERGIRSYTMNEQGEGWVWQAEKVVEDGRPVRYYGFLGCRYILGQVPAEDIELLGP